MKKILNILLLGILITGFNVYATGDKYNKDKDKDKKDNTSTASASMGIHGQVLDAITGEVLVGVAVKLEETKNTVYTDFEGKFRFNSIKPGNYKLYLEMISYRKEIQNIKIEFNNKQSIKIQLIKI
ncbi:MAG: carboxypeptidase-like regulatory domain-containing protein [Bacteroidetes bacterium]|nr:carboxypeptidase-like regulatory domain-containing protein [Bacteroidota bacterium]